MSRRFIDVTVVLLVVFGSLPASASDWGYDDGVTPMKAVALPLRGGKANTTAVKQATGAPRVTVGKTGVTAKSVVAAKIVPTAPRTTSAAGASKAAPKAVPTPAEVAAAAGGKMDLNVECWSQLYHIASGKKLNDDQRKRLASIVKRLPARQSITRFWPKVTDYLAAHPEQKDNYSNLLRALLRLRTRTLPQLVDSASPPAVNTDEMALINEVLGPQRIAVEGSPPFSEDAVEAYADMACFLYEQNNPGKTIDAFDNRAMFASVVCEKFRKAPSQKDKAAMAAFDLAWAKFKVAWDGANEQTRTAMVAALKNEGAGRAGNAAQDPVLKAVLDNWLL